MKRYLLLTVFTTTFVMGWGQSIWTKITSIDNWDNEGVYWLTHITKSGKTNYYYVWESLQPANDLPSNVYMGYNGTSYTGVKREKLQDIHLFRIIRVSENEWYIYDINEQKYVSHYNGTGTSFNFISLESSRNNLNKVSISINNSALADIMFTTNTFLRYNQNVNKLRVYNGNNSDAKALTIYKLKDYTVLDAMADLPQQDHTQDVLMYRNFEKDVYNTIILPCKVDDYKAVFGNEVTAYELKKIDTKNLTVVEKKDNILNAKQPYLLKGTFSKSPYTIGNQEVSYDGNDPIVTIEGGKIHGAFASHPLDEGDLFIYCNNFYPYDREYYNDKNMAVTPYKWFIPKSDQNSAKHISITPTEATAIRTIISPEKNTVYSVTGLRMNNNSPLPRGVYIKNGKKYVQK